MFSIFKKHDWAEADKERYEKEHNATQILRNERKSKNDKVNEMLRNLKKNREANSHG